jgi:hypothetical protein
LGKEDGGEFDLELSGELQDEGLLWQGQGVVVASGQEDEVSSGFFSAQDL